MDPQLFEEIARGDADEEIDAIIRLAPGTAPPPQVRIVAVFGDIATCRLLRRDIIDVRNHPSVLSLKASRYLTNDEFASHPVRETRSRRRGDVRRPNVAETGRGVVVGIIDYGCDFAHRAFRTAAGRSRVRYLWDQRTSDDTSRAPEPYNRGRLFTRREIDAALREADPYAALDYHPAPSRRASAGSHGTHVMDIAAGNGRGDGPVGVAPGAEIIFVHVSSAGTGGTRNFGDSVGVLEAIDFIHRMAGETPCVLNISMGRHGGPHDGSTLTERAIDALLAGRRGRSLVQSAGNYYDQRIHCGGQLATRETTTMRWEIKAANERTKELEIWYSGRDRMTARLYGPGGDALLTLPRNTRRDIVIEGEVVGRAYHRVGDPGNGDTHIDIFIYNNAPDGEWRLTLAAVDAQDGQWHAWLERDGDRATQTRFTQGPISNATTTGTIAHARGAIQVAAHEGTIRSRRPRFATFSSAGPSRDARTVPLVAAPGRRIWAARSAVPGRENAHTEITSKSGTSMAAPHVTGLVALILEANPQATQREIRAILRGTARPHRRRNRSEVRSAWGIAAPEDAVRAARRRRTGGADDVELLPITPEDGAEQGPSTPLVTASEWRLVANWTLRRLLPTDGSGMLPANMTPRASAPLPPTVPEAARAVAQALLNHRARAAGLSPSPLPSQSFVRHPTLDPVARQVVPAMPPSATEWAELGSFMERQVNARRDGTAGRVLFGTDAVVNRLNMAHHLACARLSAFPGGTHTPAYCAYPQTTTPDMPIRILMAHLATQGDLVDWSAMTMDQRRVYIMHRLVSRYRYSRNAAAGLVGNFQSESRLIPEIVEGGSEAGPRRSTPMGGGARRRHSPTEIRDRSSRPARGPSLPGVGLAQWTTRARRSGLFAYSYNGVTPGAYILFFMDAQIDYVIHELTTGYRGVERVLRRAGVSRDDASDEVVYTYERPGAMLRPNPSPPPPRLLRPRTDPQVQRVFRARRANAAAAARAYDAAHPPARPAEAHALIETVPTTGGS